MFGDPFEWTQQYIDGVQHLEKDGWYWKIFTPHPFESKGNVEIIPMTITQYADLVEEKLKVRPSLELSQKGIPNIHITDYYIFSGVVFEDYLKDADFWGITNMDVVYGRLSEFFPDEMLEVSQVFSDDVQAVNGVFCLFRNVPDVNNLFGLMENWQNIILQHPCRGCSTEGKHGLFGSDEYMMTDLLKQLGERVAFNYPKYYPMLSHDRLEQHVPDPKLEVKEDGSLWELFKDVKGPDWEHARPFIGREIPYFHFQRTKRWPL